MFFFSKFHIPDKNRNLNSIFNINLLSFFYLKRRGKKTDNFFSSKNVSVMILYKHLKFIINISI